MDTVPAHSEYRERSLPAAIGRTALRVIWHAIRLPIVTVLIILEPFVTVVLMGIATLGVLMCLFYEFLIKAAHFPFWLMLCLSIGSALLLLPYYTLIRIFSMSGERRSE
ncbi:MAG TPA: hypothetical protein VMU55_03930 [Solirubrobacteraceae bacterium]|nr:hypothetical protein [Solirubrobacteraceae bacterium]